MSAPDHLSGVQFHLQHENLFGGGNVSASRGDDHLGEMSWWHSPKGPIIEDIHVEPEHRRKGVATALYQHAVSQGVPLHHNITRTDAGEAWARSVGASKRRARIPDSERD